LKLDRTAGAGKRLKLLVLSLVFPKKDQAIDYAQNRACFRSGEIRILDSGSNLGRIIPFDETERKL
jgi:hypothetical protein